MSVGNGFAVRLSCALVIAVGFAPVAIALGESVSIASPTVVWEPAGGSAGIDLVGVPTAILEPLRTASGTDPRWSSLFAVHVADADGSVPEDRPAILGTYQVVGARAMTIRFTPRFALAPNRPYRATFDPDGPTGPTPPLLTNRPIAAPDLVPSTVVARVEPAGDRLPANLLRFYVFFSAPMGRGDAYAHLKLEDAAGQPLDHPFLELGEELWDPTGTRLTVLLDPGRVKRGLKPHEELGPIFFPDRSYTLRINPAWHDANGQPLADPASKTFTTGPTDEASPTPATWRIVAPRAGSVAPLVVEFADTLDRATVASGLTLVDGAGQTVAGNAEARLDGTGWLITPAHPWAAGTYTLAVNPDLEDLCGNSIRRPFEVDVQRDVPVTPDSTQIRLPVMIVD